MLREPEERCAPRSMIIRSFQAALILAGLLTLTLVPGFLIGQRFSPVVALQNESILEGIANELLIRFAFNPVLMAGIGGALAAWFIGRTWMAVIAMPLAGVAFAFGPGDKIPLFVGIRTSAAGKMLATATLVPIEHRKRLANCVFFPSIITGTCSSNGDRIPALSGVNRQQQG